MDPDMVRQQFEEEAEAKRRAKAGAGAVSVVPPAGPSAVAVAAQTVMAASPPAAGAYATAVPPGAPVPPVAFEDLAVVSGEAAVVFEEPAAVSVPLAAVEEPVVVPAPPAPAREAVAIPAPIPAAPAPVPPVQVPPIPVPWAAWAATAALGHIEGALAGQGLALFLAGRLQFEPLHTLILTVLCAYLCAIFIAALFTADPVFTDRRRFLRSLGAGAMIAAICMQAAMTGSGVLANGTAALMEPAAWTTYAAAASLVFVIVWPLNLWRLKWAARPPG
jgi:hypothetical protein